MKLATADRSLAPFQPIPFSRIVWLVGERMGVTVSDIWSKRRGEKICGARQLIAVLARQFTIMSYPEIAEATNRVCKRTGKPSHSIVVDQVRRWGERLKKAETDPSAYLMTTAGKRHPQEVFDELVTKLERTAAA